MLLVSLTSQLWRTCKWKGGILTGEGGSLGSTFLREREGFLSLISLDQKCHGLGTRPGAFTYKANLCKRGTMSNKLYWNTGDVHLSPWLLSGHSTSKTLSLKGSGFLSVLEVPALYYGLLFIGCYLPAVTILFLKTEDCTTLSCILSYIWLQWPDCNQGNGLSQLQLSQYTEVFCDVLTWLWESRYFLPLLANPHTSYCI